MHLERLWIWLLILVLSVVNTVNNFVAQMGSPNSKYAFIRTLHGIKNGPELKGRLSRIICPTLMVCGENDKMISANHANEYDEI